MSAKSFKTVNVANKMQLRPYQTQLRTDIQEARQAGSRNVLAVMPTGSGKTVTFADLTAHNQDPVALLAHRTELVSQISMTLARYGVEHRLIAPAATVRSVRQEHYREFKRYFDNPQAPHGVGSVDTLIARLEYYNQWRAQVGLWIIDEAAHVIGDPPNKWGRCVAMFPNADGVGFTATPTRADGKGLGRHAHGVFDAMVEGPTVGWLIRHGYLSDYRLIAKPSNINIDDLKATASGDYSPKKLRLRSHESQIVGDVVEEYQRYAAGKQGITFTVDVETSKELAEAFNAAGIPAASVSAKTPEGERIRAIRAFRRGKLRQLTNCDLFGEGFDVPGVEVVSLARPTMSLALHLQQVGRSLRSAEGKEHAIIIDHVGNWERHGLPDTPRTWTLNARQRRKTTEDPDAIALTSCLSCFLVFERKLLPKCPHCGYVREPSERSRPEHVDGDLTELDLTALAQLREAVQFESPDKVANRAYYAGGAGAAASQRGNQVERIRAQKALQEVIATWAGLRKADGQPDSVSYREFYLTFGVDVLTAQTLPRAEMEELRLKIERNEPRLGVGHLAGSGRGSA